MKRKQKNLINSKMSPISATTLSILWLLLALFLLGYFPSCKQLDENGFRTYIIKSGKHKSRTRYKTTKTNCLQFQAIFDESAVYTSQDPANQYDVNKLYGLSDCGDNHTENSIRFGWRWLNDSLEILWFKHTNNNFSFAKIKSIDFDDVIDFSIQFDNNYYYMSVGSDTVTIARPCNRSSNRKYFLWPYFGGNETAPHDIKILIKDL